MKTQNKVALMLCREATSPLAQFDSELLLHDGVLDICELNARDIKIAARLRTVELRYCSSCINPDCKREFVWICLTYVTEHGAIVSSCGDTRHVERVRRFASHHGANAHYPIFPYAGLPQMIYSCKLQRSIPVDGALRYDILQGDAECDILTQADICSLNADSAANNIPFTKWCRTVAYKDPSQCRNLSHYCVENRVMRMLNIYNRYSVEHDSDMSDYDSDKEEMAIYSLLRD